MLFCLHSACWILHYIGPGVSAQDLIGQPIVEVVVEQEGRRVTDPLILALVQTRVGQTLSMRDVRETFDHLYNLRRFDDIQPAAEAAPGGVRVRYVLVPAHPIDRIEFQGALGVSTESLRSAITDRFGRTPSASRTEEAVAHVAAFYRTRGFPSATVAVRIEETHDPDRASLIFDVNAGRRARIADVRFVRTDPDGENTSFELPEIRVGELYDPDQVQRALERWEERMRSRGYYEARATFGPTIPDDAYLTVNLRRGPRVVLEFTGDSLPDEERQRLVPIRAEASADEDLLEDAQIAIERYLHAGGYRDAVVQYMRNDSTAGELRITFNVTRGPRYSLEALRITGNMAMSAGEIEKILGVARGDLFVREALEVRVAALVAAYRALGFTRAQGMVTEAVLPSETPNAADRRVEVTVDIDEGPRTTVRNVAFTGNTVMTESQLRNLVTVQPGAPYVEAAVTEGRERIDLRYRNLGYARVAVRQDVSLAEDDTRADVTYTIAEGPQVLVERIIVTGNDRTDTETILNELEFREGEPLGLTALANSRVRLTQLGLFRRVDIEQIPHAGEPREDVLIRVEEADRTTLGYGGGVEATVRARPTGPGGAAEDHLDLAPRGFFEIGRRNLWGSNRSVNLFTRVSLRTTDVVTAGGGNGDSTETNVGFNEYRVVGSFREPRLSSRSELLITGIVEQAIRTTFNFSRRIARAEVGTRVTPGFGVTARYSFERTKLFDEKIVSEEQGLLIDKLFPQVRLSKFAGSVIHDTRDDLLDPSRGTFLIVDTDVAGRAIGSEVGFIRTYVQGFLYRELPTARRIVAAFGARVGAARGFERVKDGTVVREVPASERFFAGGDTTVRGFSLDRLGNEDTISPGGFPLGGNSVVILNAELRAQLFGDLQGVGFIDAGNVFPLASGLSLTELRPAAGFGVRYNSPLGPIRLDLGFNLNPKQFADVRERRTVFHISLGQAF